jgi:deoxyribodipyrimidine photolyase-related protein
VHYCYTADYLLERRLKRYSERHGISLQQSASPCFINTKESLAEYFDKKEKFFLHDFYIKQRKQLDVLMVNHKPVGGKWSFDELNRKRIPKGCSIPESKIPAPNQFITEAEKYVSKHFSDNYGDAFFFQYPATFKDALNWLDDFLIERLIHFGPFQDAIIKKESTLFHSILTPLLNTGLLTPKIVIDRVMEFSSDHPIPLSSLEGFIRQVIGWREFMRGVYDKREYSNEQVISGSITKAFQHHFTTQLQELNQ